LERQTRANERELIRRNAPVIEHVNELRRQAIEVYKLKNPDLFPEETEEAKYI